MYQKKKIVFIVITYFCVSILHAAFAFEQMRTYTVADGLVGPIVPVIYQDSKGVMWLGSDRGGVSRYDGNTFIPTVSEEKGFRGRTIAITEDKWGNIFFLSKHPSEGLGVISIYDGDTFEHFADGNCLTVDNDGNVWVGSNNSITRYTSLSSQDPFQEYIVNISDTSVAKINVIFQSRDGTIWIGGNDAQGVLIIRFQGNTDTWQTGPIQRIVDLPNIPTDRTIHAIAQDADDNIWFGGQALLIRYNGKEFEAVFNDPERTRKQAGATEETNFLERGNVSVRSDSRGRIWFSDDFQLSWWEGNQLERLKNLNIEASQNIHLQGVFEVEDAWNKLWFASETGAHQYEESFFDKDKIDIFELETTLTESPEFPYKLYGVDDGLGSNNIQTIFEAIDGKIWFGHDNGVTVYEPQPVIINHTSRPILESNSIRNMFADSSGTLWLSIPGGVAQYLPDEEKLNQYPIANITLENVGQEFVRFLRKRTEIINIFEVNDDIWFLDKPIRDQSGATHYGLFRFRNGSFERMWLQIRPNFGPGGEPIYNDSLNPIISSNQNPWIVLGGWLFLPTETELLRFLPDGRTHSAHFQTQVIFGSPSSVITSLHTDSQNRLWCYYDTGEVKRFTFTGNRMRQQHVEVVPINSVVPILSQSNRTFGNWFYNNVSGQLMYWENLEIADTLSELPGAASGMPLFAVNASNNDGEKPQKNPDEVSNADLGSITFVFRDGIKTYLGTELKNSVAIDLDEVRNVITTSNGDLWLATSQGAVHYDGENVETFTTQDGFLVDDLRDIHEDHWKNIWFATWGGGIVRYDGESFQSITTKDGLIHNNVSSIRATNNQDLWFGTEGGTTQYRASLGALPFCRIISVDAGKTFEEQFKAETGKRTFTEITELLPARQKNMTIKFQGISPLRDEVEYRFRLLGINNNSWTTVSSDINQNYKTTFGGSVVQTYQPQDIDEDVSSPQITYEGLKSGRYTFLIKAFRQGWPYTQQPAVLNFTIDQPIWTRWRNYLPSLILVAAAGSLLYRLIINRRQTAQLRVEMREKEEAEMERIRSELNEAQNIQMGLLPTEPPHTQTFDIAGMSIPATQVGGDFFDYLIVENGQTAIAVADAAGKGIRGAMNAVLTNGMLHEVARFKSDADVILTDLNAGLAPRMYGPSFIALNLAVLNEEDKKVDYANGGQPYPLIKRGDVIIELENSDLPLGSMKNVQYESITFDLKDGDFLIFHTDGLIEALNENQEMYGTDRLNDTTAKIPVSSSSEEVIEHIVKDVQSFVQDAEQYDDMTIVVLKLVSKTE